MKNPSLWWYLSGKIEPFLIRASNLGRFGLQKCRQAMVADTIHGSIHEAWWAGPMVCWGWGGSDGDDVKCGGCDWESKVVPHGPWCLLPPLCRITFPMKPAVQRSCLMRCIKITGAEWLLVYVELEILAQLWSVFAKRCLLLRFFSLSLSHYQIPSWKLTWKLKLPPWKGNTILQNTFWGYMTLRIFDPTDSAARNILTELYISLDVLMGCTSPKISAPKLATMRQPAKSFPQTIEVRFHQPEFQIQFMLLFGSGFQDWAPIFDF